VFGCEKKMRRKKEVRESMEREKLIRNIVDLMYCLEEERLKRNRRERSVDYFQKY
jgi:hypothetical protein